MHVNGLLLIQQRAKMLLIRREIPVHIHAPNLVIELRIFHLSRLRRGEK